MATVDYGDGTGLEPLALTPAETFSLSHSYNRPGTFTVTVAVKDPFGEVGTQKKTVVVVPFASGFGKGRDAFVTALYNKVLGRAPELAGLYFWSGLLARGIKPKTDAMGIWKSPEHQSLMSEHPAPHVRFARALADALAAWRGAARLKAKPSLPAGAAALMSESRLRRDT